MDLKTAKTRNDYRFTLNGIDEGRAVLEDLRNGVMTYLTERSEPLIGAAVLEIGYLDVELNIFSEAQVTTLPEKMEKILGDKERLQWFAAKQANAKDMFFIGRGLDYAISLEGSLKLKEISYIH